MKCFYCYGIPKFSYCLIGFGFRVHYTKGRCDLVNQGFYTTAYFMAQTSNNDVSFNNFSCGWTMECVVVLERLRSRL